MSDSEDRDVNFFFTLFLHMSQRFSSEAHVQYRWLEFQHAWIGAKENPHIPLITQQEIQFHSGFFKSWCQLANQPTIFHHF